MAASSDFEFVIPLSLDALQEAPSTRQYAVRYISTCNEIPKRLQECNANFRQHGCEFICSNQNFDALYSVLQHFKSLDMDVKEKAYDLMIKSLAKLTSQLVNLLDDISNLVTSERLHWLNIIKMTTYISCSLLEAFETFYNKPSQSAMFSTGKGRKKGGGGGPNQDGSSYWEEQRGKMLLQLYSLVQHPLHRLCSPPVMEEDYVNLVANCCYKILETPTLCYSKSKNTRDSIFQIIGTLVSKFNHGLACSLKIMQCVQHFDHLVSVSAQGLSLLVTNYSCSSVISEVIREIAKMDLGSDISASAVKDNATVRNYTQFLMELCELVPQSLVPSLPLLYPFLDNDNYSLRNCLLSMMSSLVLKVLSREDLDDKNKDLRDNCLDSIEDHMMDVNAFVRSKVLQLMMELVESGSLPLSRQQQVLSNTICRLMDKSAQVRKNAIGLLTAFLKKNPFAAKLPLSELKEQMETESEKLRELCPDEDVGVGSSDGEDKGPTPQQAWHSKLEEIITAVQKAFPEESDSEEDINSSSCDSDKPSHQLPEECSLNDGVSLIAEALNDGKYLMASLLLSNALENFHGATVLSYDASTVPPIQSSRADELTPVHIKHLALLQRIFLSHQAMRFKNSQEEQQQEEKKESEEVRKQRIYLKYLTESVEFAKLIQQALPLVVQLLSSKLLSDVLEAIKFFVTAFEFGVLDAMAGVREMLVLVWSREQAIQTAVVEAYRKLYISVEGNTERVRAQHIVRNLIVLTTGANLGELASLEEIIAQFMKNGDLTKACITLLWEKFTLTLPETTEEEAKASLVLLSMAANSEPVIVQSNITVLITCGLVERGRKDFSLVMETCSTLSKLAVNKPKTEDTHAPFRLDKDHELFSKLSELLIEGINNMEDCHYSPMAVQAITTIYSLAENPDAICENILRKITEKYLGSPVEEDGEDIIIPTFILARYFVVVGRIAIRQLVHLDTFIFSELKRRSHIKEEHDNIIKTKKSKKDLKNKRKSLIVSASESGRSSHEDEDELSLMGAVADDVEAEYIRSVCDKELLNAENMLGPVLPFIIKVCSNPSKYTDQKLQAAACFALSNFMMMSADACENNLQLLFTILEKSDYPAIRGNTMIALGDLSFRFPNLVEPWTPRLYARLSDGDCSVRLNTMTVLTHLILNDMVKVKGQISDIALCINDEEHRISGMAKLFFTELSRKQNALYNVLPDIISRLSDPELKLDEVSYRTVISHIFSLIQKDKQVEGLVEKLCHRLQATDTSRQWRDLTYCMSLLSLNEKCIRKLLDLFSCYADKLHEPDVHKMFLSMLSKARKLGKQETKTMLEELESKIEKSHEKGVEEQNLVDKATACKTGVTKKQTTKQTKSRRRSTQSSESENNSGSEEDLKLNDNSSDGEQDENIHPALRKTEPENRRLSARTSRGKVKNTVLMDSDSEEPDEENPKPILGKKSKVSKKEEVPVRKNTRITRHR